jgi:hypothetical protein
MSRLLALHLRCRHVPIAGPAAVVATAAVALLGDDPHNPLETADFAVLALALGFSVLGNGFSGADEHLERTASIRWPVWRAVHVLAAGVLLFGVAALVSSAPIGLLCRDAAGFAGLTALAAALFGGQLSWTLPIAWAGVAAVVPPVGAQPVLALVTWPAQAPDNAGAATLAIVLGVLGVACYALRSGRVHLA